jgi:H+/Cl- antiporter ClcA
MSEAPPAPPAAGGAGAAPDERRAEPQVRHVVAIALIAILFTALYMSVYGALNAALWENHWAFVLGHRWTIPVGVLTFSLLVGLLQQYLQAPTALSGGFTETLKGEGPQDNYRTFPGALLTALCSLLSGASVGPEGTIAVLVQDLAAWTRARLRISARTAQGFDVAALASAFNGVVGNPLFTGVLATEFRVGGAAGLRLLVWNLLAGSIGFSVYALLGLQAFAQAIAFEPIEALQPVYLLYAVLLGLLGAALALVAGGLMRVLGGLIPRLVGERVVVRALAAGAVVSAVGVALPELLFSGEQSIHQIIAEPDRYGVGLLLLMAGLKLVLLALSLKSGYLGGPVFPVLFACTMVGLALHLLFPAVPLSLLVLCIEGPALALALGAPLTAILLVAVVGTADANELAVLVLATVVGLLVGTALKDALARRAAPAARVPPAGAPAPKPAAA